MDHENPPTDGSDVVLHFDYVIRKPYKFRIKGFCESERWMTSDTINFLLKTFSVEKTMNTSPLESGWPNKTLLGNVLLMILLVVRKLNCGCLH